MRWIREGIRRNKDAHEGTEWLHVRILEKNSVLGLDFGNGSGPVKPAKGWPAGNTGKPVKDEELITAIIYQLHERIAARRTSAAFFVIILTRPNNVGTLPEEGIERRKPMSEMKEEMPFDEVIPEFFD